jgi:nucleotide-binding universal stress UspA family protein
MNYRSLLVLLGHDAHCAPRTEVAIRLAQMYDCHLVGLAPTDLVDLPSAPAAAASLAECAAIVWDALREQAERAADRFRDDCHAAGLKSFEAVIDECGKIDSLVRHAHCSDLTVLSQADPASKTHAADRDLLERAVLFSARPTLLVPYAGFVDNIGSRVMVSWDDSREAARAIADALPLLRLATHAQVVCWHEPDVGRHDTVRSRLDALKKWLMWHGVSAEVRIEPMSRGIADAMLSHAADFDADLIVMGAYGHSRLAERVLGGATRGLLASMTVPVLMSH